MAPVHMLDPEVLGDPLDLSRPELAPLMRRYHSAATEALPTALRQPRALIVGSPENAGDAVKDELEKQGWSVEQCLGPGRSDGCPILHEEPCELRRSADVAFVYVDPRRLWGGTGMIPRLLCAVESGSAAVIVLEGRFDDPAVDRGRATVGALRSAKVIVEAATRVVMKETA